MRRMARVSPLPGVQFRQYNDFRRSREVLAGARPHNIEDLRAKLQQHETEGVLPLPWALRTLMMSMFEVKRTAEAMSIFQSMLELHKTLHRQQHSGRKDDKEMRFVQPVVEALMDGLVHHGDPHEALEIAMQQRSILEPHVPRATMGFTTFGDLSKPEIHGRIAVIDQQMLGNLPIGALLKHYDGVVIPFTAIRFVSRLPEGREKSAGAERVATMLNTTHHKNKSVFIRTLPFLQQIKANSCLPFLDDKEVEPQVKRLSVEASPKPQGGAVPSPARSSKRFSPSIQGNHFAAAALHLARENPHTEFHVVSTSAHVQYQAQICRVVSVDFPSELPIKAPTRRGEGTPGEPQTEPPQRATRSNHSEEFKTQMAEPNHQPPIMRIVVDPGRDKLRVANESRDVLLTPNLFNEPDDSQIYRRLVKELDSAADFQHDLQAFTSVAQSPTEEIMQRYPTLAQVIGRIKRFFGVDIRNMRISRYENALEWTPPQHYDSNGPPPPPSPEHNITIGATFGCSREAVFEEPRSKRVLSLALDNGSVFSFSRDITLMWKQGVRKETHQRSEGGESRITITLWGNVGQKSFDAFV